MAAQVGFRQGQCQGGMLDTQYRFVVHPNLVDQDHTTLIIDR